MNRPEPPTELYFLIRPATYLSDFFIFNSMDGNIMFVPSILVVGYGKYHIIFIRQHPMHPNQNEIPSLTFCLTGNALAMKHISENEKEWKNLKSLIPTTGSCVIPTFVLSFLYNRFNYITIRFKKKKKRINTVQSRQLILSISDCI